MPEAVRRRLGWLTSPWFSYQRPTRLGPVGRNYLLTHPEDLRWVLLAQAEQFPKDARVAGKEGQQREGQGIITSEGKRHKDLRARFTPAYSAAQRLFLASATGLTEQTLEQWPSASALDLSRSIRSLCLSVLLEALLGREAAEEKTLRRAIRLRQLYYERLWHWKLPFRERIPLVCGFSAAQRFLDERLLKAARQRRQQPGPDVISALAECAQTEQEVVDEARTFIAAGHDATAEALIWSLAVLGCHPDRQDWLLAAPEHAEACLAETLRLYPPTWLYGRFQAESCRLPSGHALPARSNLLLCPYLQHRHPDYFVQAEEFLPERFLASDWRGRWRYVYYPFGFGPHMCLGEKIARAQCLHILSLITGRFRWQLDRLPKMNLGVALRPAGPFRLNLEPR